MNAIADQFKDFGLINCKGSSPLYEHLSYYIAEDEQILEIASHANPGQPLPSIFFGSIHYLLLKGKIHELRQYYGSIVEKPKSAITAFPYFKDFCLQYSKEIISLIKVKLVQTNDVRRNAYLYPAFCYIYEKTKKPIAIIEIGTSAGIQLMWDKYSYSYNSKEIYGNVKAELNIKSEIRGERQPLLHKMSPPVSTRIGVDLHINDISDSEDYLWLKSLIWPEHADRSHNFEKAVRGFVERSAAFIEGDGVNLLTDLASFIPQESTLCVFHTFMANQLSVDNKLKLIATVKKLGQRRDVFHLYNNLWDDDLHLDYYLGSKEYKNTIAEIDAFGRWFEWKLVD